MEGIKEMKEIGDLTFRTDWDTGTHPIIYTIPIPYDTSIGFSEYDYIPNLEERKAMEIYYTQRAFLTDYVWRGMDFCQSAEIWVRLGDYNTSL